MGKPAFILTIFQRILIILLLQKRKKERNYEILRRLLKFLSIVLMLIGAVICTICCFQGVELKDPALYWVGGVIFLCVLIVALCIWGTGSAILQIAKLKKRVTQLEQRIWNNPVAEPVAQNPVVKPVTEEAVPVETPAEAAAPVNGNQKKWLPIGMGAVIVVLLVVLIVVVAGGKGNENNNDAVLEPPQPQLSNEETVPPAEDAGPEIFAPEIEGNGASAAANAEELPMGKPLSTDFVDITFHDVIVEKDIQKAVTIDHVTRITGPDPLDGQKYICLIGTIVNTSTAPLPVYDFFVGRFDVDGYTYDVTANDCDVLSGNGDTESMIDPLMEYEVRIYKAIPDALADTYTSSSFTFGFYDDFDNKDLSYNKAFADDPIAECPYQFFIPFQ